ncbi:MAG TPA: ECF transporter S component [Clostridiales bacterium]|nr:ECF transporter S component [Clostridiales bacterium]HPV00937.1 ECF transporter S component [Clostridiales bacterium]
MEKAISKRKFETRQIAIVGMLSAISIVLGASGVGFIPLPTAKATIMHIPVIIGAILEGPVVGMAAGLIFGIFSIVQNLTNPSLLSFAFLNPLVSVLPRMLIGVTSHYSYRIPFIKSNVLKIAVSAVIGTLTNTVGVLGLIYLLYADEFAQAMKIDVSKAAAGIAGIAATNAPGEIIVSVALSVPIVLAVRKILKK